MGTRTKDWLSVRKRACVRLPRTARRRRRDPAPEIVFGRGLASVTGPDRPGLFEREGSTMSGKLIDTQLVLLSAASQREDLYVAFPTGARLGPARKVAAKLLEAGLVREVRARKDAPVWRRDEGTEQPFALKLTGTGLKAIALEANGDGEKAAPALTGEDEAGSSHGSGPSGVATDVVLFLPVIPRAGSKISGVITALQKGATIDEIVAATGWLPHTARAALTGLRKRGYAIVTDRSDRARGTVYRIAPAEARGPEREVAVGDGDSTAGAEPEARKGPRRTRRAA